MGRSYTLSQSFCIVITVFEAYSLTGCHSKGLEARILSTVMNSTFSFNLDSVSISCYADSYPLLPISQRYTGFE